MKGKILRKSITGILALSMLCSSLYSTCSYAEEIPDLTDTEEIITDSTDISIQNTDEAESNQDMTFDTIEETEEIYEIDETEVSPDDTETADEVESSFVYDTTNSLPAFVEEETAVHTQETVIVHEYAEGSPDDTSDDNSTEDTSTDAWFLDYPDSTINDTGLAVSPVTGGYSGAPPGRPPDMFGIVVLLLLIGFMLGISDKVELPFDLLIEINALYEDIRAVRAGIYALNTIKTALQSEAIFEKRREIKKNCSFSDLWFAYPNFV